MAETSKVFYSTANVYDEYSTINRRLLLKENFPVKVYFLFQCESLPFQMFLRNQLRCAS